jgi:putative oxidoreductase
MKYGVMNKAVWVLQVLLALAFMGAGGAKLAGVPAMVQMFDAIGLGQWARYTTGAIELLAALLLMLPAACGLGALLAACTMVGAVLTHMTLIGGSPLPALVLLVIASAVAWHRRDRLNPLRAPLSQA